MENLSFKQCSENTSVPVRGRALYESTKDILESVRPATQQRSRASSMGRVPLQGTNIPLSLRPWAHTHTMRTPVMGFSLIELMVSLTIFSIVMTVSLGTLLTLIDANTKAQALSSSMTNLSFALDSISRNLRTGRDFNCTGDTIDNSMDDDYLHQNYGDVADCPFGESTIVFTPGLDSDQRIAYRLYNGQIEQWVDVAGYIEEWVPITSNVPPGAVTINEFLFILNGSESVASGDENQPQIAILIDGQVDAGLPEPTRFRIQTNVTQRILDY